MSKFHRSVFPLFTIILGRLSEHGPPPTSHFLLLDGTDFLLLNGTFFFLLEP